MDSPHPNIGHTTSTGCTRTRDQQEGLELVGFGIKKVKELHRVFKFGDPKCFCKIVS